MDIVINDVPTLEIGDIVSIDDMMRGRKLQVINYKRDVVINDKKERKEFHHVALYDTVHYGIYRSFNNMYELQEFIDKTRHCVLKSKEYEWHLRKKG